MQDPKNNSPIAKSSNSERFQIGDHVTIYRRGKRGFWCADFHIGARHGRKALKTRNREVAERNGRALEQQLINGEIDVEPIRSLPIDKAIDQFIDFKRTVGKSRKTLVKYGAELKRLAKYLKETYNVTTLQRLTIPMLDSYIAHRKKVDQRSAYTLYTHQVLHKTFTKWCRKRRLVKTDPLVDLDLEEPKRIKHPAATLEQLTAILAITHGYLFGVLITLAFAGLRIEELQTLRSQDVDLKNAVIHVRGRQEWDPKSRASQRDVPIHRRLLAILKAIHSKGEWFFNALPSAQFRKGDNHINPRDVNELFKALATRCGFVVGRKKRGLTLHALRRFFKTFSLDSGVPKPMVDAWAGHEDQDDMDRFYYDPQKSAYWMEKVPFGEPTDGDLKHLTGDSNEERTV